MAGDIRQRMIGRTAVLLAKKGLQGTSFSEVLEASGAPRGSLYHHFPGGKDELVMAALGATADQMREALKGLSGAPAGEVARAFGRVWRTILERSDFAVGCAVVAITVAAESPSMLNRAGEVFRSFGANLAKLLIDGGVASERSQALAVMLISGFEGAVVLARAQRSFEQFDLVAAELYAIVDAAAEKRTKRRDR